MICPGCGTKVEDGDLRYNGRMPEECWHAHCWADRRPPPTNTSDLRAQLATNLDNFNRALENLRGALRRR